MMAPGKRGRERENERGREREKENEGRRRGGEMNDCEREEKILRGKKNEKEVEE